MDEYPLKLRRLSKILAETGFLEKNKPTDKGLFAARVYGENTILVAEAVWLGWFRGPTPEELCGGMVMLAAEDRERRGDRPARRPRPYPTPPPPPTPPSLPPPFLRVTRIDPGPH